jgi:hypothetical protein
MLMTRHAAGVPGALLEEDGLHFLFEKLVVKGWRGGR